MANHLYDALFLPHEGSTRPFLILPDGAEVSHDDFLRLSARYAHALTGMG